MRTYVLDFGRGRRYRLNKGERFTIRGSSTSYYDIPL
jgi:hypothetical protein